MKNRNTGTSWNVIALSGWFLIVFGLIGIVLHVVLLTENQNAGWFGVFGVVNGLLMVIFGGPVKIRSRKSTLKK